MTDRSSYSPARSRLTALVWVIASAMSHAAVDVDFSHSYTGATNPIQNTGDITLAFTVDGSGQVTLDASSADPDPASYVNEFDGPVGTVSDPVMWGHGFTIVLSSSGSGSLRISNSGAGLSVQGGNAERLDLFNEQITATVTAAGTEFKLLGLGYADATTTAGTQMNVAGTAYALSDASGTVDVSAQGVAGTFTIDSTTDTDAQGFVLSGLSFDLNTLLAASDATVSFANSGSGFGPAPPFVLAGNSSATITLDFSINSAGVISLDASTTSTNGAFPSMVAEWDSPNIGSVAEPSLLGKSFTLTGSASGGSGYLAISELGGGGIGIQGENSNRVDGLNYGSGDVNSAPETLTWTLNAPVGLELVLKNWSYIEGAGGDIRVSNGTTNSDFADITDAAGTLDLPELPLAHGESLTFTEIPGMGATTGAGISGFTFEVAVPSNLPEGFDNGAGNHLWTTAANWNPDGVPAAPTDAIIDGYHVILNSVASASPDELQIIDGSLTLTDSGALSMRAMTIGRDVTRNVRLVIDGSGVSFGYSGSSPADEFAVGTAATVETKPDAGGCEPLELGAAELVLDLGSQWILDGTHASGPFNLGDRFALANFGSFSGNTGGIRTRNFDLPADRRLELVATPTSLYYEVVARTVATGPNIIIISTDDQAAGQHFGFDGRDCLTPTLDTLASTGINFTSAFAASTVCGPSRYALLTSRWPSRNTSANFLSLYPPGTLGRFGVSDTELEHDGQNIGAWLRQAGYRTGFVGKSHVLDDDLKSTSNWAAKGLLTYSQTADPATDADTNGKMKHNHRVVCQMMREHGFDFVDSFYHANLAELRNDSLNVHNQEWITKGALDFIEENHAERFFLYMAPTINHGPVRNDLTKTLLADKGYTSAGYLPNEDYSFMPSRSAIVNQVTSAGKDFISARETWLDYSIAAILNKLTQHGIRNDTLIIFTSDHGEKTLYGPLVWGKSSLFDLGMKVPMVMNWPNGITSPGRTYDGIMSQVDIAPTLLALTGASALPSRPVDGVSLVPVFNGSSAPVRDDLFCEIGYARAVRTKERKYVAVRYTPSIYSQIESGYLWQKYDGNTATGQFTEPRPYYVNNNQLGSLAANSHPANTYFADDQLYNLTSDPNENTNIYGQEPATAYDLKKRLAAYIGDIPDRPFRQFGDSSTEFSPAPTSTPSPPASVQMQFLGLDSVQLDWTDAPDSELGYVVRKTVNGGTPEIIAELPSGATTATAALDPGVEDIVLDVASYNALGDGTSQVDLLAPENWRYRTFGDIDPTLSLPVSQWNYDADGDGETTLWEYATATDPRSGSSVARATGGINHSGPVSYLELLVPRDVRRSVQIHGSVSTTLTSWNRGEPYCTVIEDEADHLLFRSATPVGDEPRQFIRAEVAEP